MNVRIRHFWSGWPGIFLVNQQGWSQGCVKVCVNLQMLSAMTNAATPRLSLPFRGPEVT